jgi:hypothetical protein
VPALRLWTEFSQIFYVIGPIGSPQMLLQEPTPNSIHFARGITGRRSAAEILAPHPLSDGLSAAKRMHVHIES